MPTLSFDKTDTARPIAVARGGDYDGEILYLHIDDNRAAGGAGAATARRPKQPINASKYNKELKGLKPAERVKVMNALIEAAEKGLDEDSIIGLPTAARGVLGKMKEEKTTLASGANIDLPDDSMFQAIPSPDPKKREVWYVAGQSGAGKSYFARGIAEAYKKLFPDREIYLISKLNEDETLDSMKIGKPKRISLDSLLTDPPDMEEFRDCLTIWDDFDTLDKKYFDVVHKLITDLAIMGRHYGTSMLILSHYLTNYSKTRLILGEANYLVLYPLATSYKAMAYVCQHYGGLDKEDIAKLKRLGRWVCIHKNYPVYVLSANNCFLPHSV